MLLSQTKLFAGARENQRRMRLPQEDAGRARVVAALGTQLAEMGRLLELGFTVFPHGGIRVTKTRWLNRAVVHVGAGLFAKACKTYRGIIVTCESGLTEDAFVLARSLFETALAVFWILKTASRRRAQMYLAHLSMRDKKMFLEWKRTKGIKHYATARMLRTVDAQIAESARILKPKYMAGLADSYSGKSIKDTAKAVGLLKVYQIFYRHASGFGHGSDLFSHISYTPEGIPVLHVMPGPSDNLKRVMAMSYSIFRTLIQSLNDRFGLGHDAAIAAVLKDIS